MRRIGTLFALLAFLTLGACAAPRPGSLEDVARDDISALTQAILAMDEGVDPDEAARAARIAYGYTAQLAVEYEITDPPLIHNMKVNAGFKPRGLCWHWAEDMEARLDAEGFETLEMHRAIANADNPILIDHSTAIISAKGEGMFEGIVLDPWRKGGILTWSETLEDPKYTWVARDEVLDKRRRQRELEARVRG